MHEPHLQDHEPLEELEEEQEMFDTLEELSN